MATETLLEGQVCYFVVSALKIGVSRGRETCGNMWTHMNVKIYTVAVAQVHGGPWNRNAEPAGFLAGHGEGRRALFSREARI